MAVDPVCGMTVAVVPGTPSSTASSVGAETTYFCCESCKLAFDREHRTA
jgi:YHS domain-containing protein